jgi:hypothetical protein
VANASPKANAETCHFASREKELQARIVFLERSEHEVREVRVRVLGLILE